MKTAQIICFIGSWSSGLAELLVRHRDGRLERVCCDNAATARALATCFPQDEVIGKDHTVNNEALHGKSIRYKTDEFGLLQWLAPAEEHNTQQMRGA